MVLLNFEQGRIRRSYNTQTGGQGRGVDLRVPPSVLSYTRAQGVKGVQWLPVTVTQRVSEDGIFDPGLSK